MPETPHLPKPHWRFLKIVELVLIVVLIVLLAATVFRVRLFRPSETPSLARSEAVIGQARLGVFHDALPVEATVQPLQTVYLDSPEAGRIEKKFIDVGSVVKEGDPLLLLVNPALEMEIMSREAEVLQQSNAIRNTRLALDQYKLQLTQQLSDIDNDLQQQKRLYERYQELDKDNLISKHEFEKARDQYEYLRKRKDLVEKTQKSDLAIRNGQLQDAEDGLRRLETNLEAVRRRLDNLTVKAPVPGQITSLSAELGQSKSAGERLGQIDSSQGFKATTFIEEGALGRVAVRENGSFELDGSRYALVIKKIYPEVRDGRFEAELEFQGERPKTIKRGQTLHVLLDLGERPDTLILDAGEYLKTTDGSWVFRLEPDAKTAVRTKVRMGRKTAEAVEILDGLKPGDRVILSSYDRFAKALKINLE